jgi:hypothetical protein
MYTIMNMYHYKKKKILKSDAYKFEIHFLEFYTPLFYLY